MKITQIPQHKRIVENLMDPIASSRLQDDSKKKTPSKSFDHAKDDNENSAPALRPR